MHFAFNISASSKDKAKKALEKRLAADAQGCNPGAAQAVANVLIDALPKPEASEDILVVVNGTVLPDDGRQDGLSIGCSVYLVPKVDEPAETTFVDSTGAVLPMSDIEKGVIRKIEPEAQA